MDIEKIQKIIKKLPEELRRYILTFTYKPQAFVLLTDIRHYVPSRQVLQDWYINRFAWEYPNAENDWLYNDLIGFCNENHATMFGYRDYFFSIFTRMFSLKNKTRKQILRSKSIICKDSKKASNVTWGLLEIEERIKFMEFYNI